MNLDHFLSTHNLNLSGFVFSCGAETCEHGEHFIEKHLFVQVTAGNVEVTAGAGKANFKEGDFFFVRRNQMVRYVKNPATHTGFNTTCIALDDETLKQVWTERYAKAKSAPCDAPVVSLKDSFYLRSYFDSLKPYLRADLSWSPPLINVKIREAIYLLLETDPGLEHILFEFGMPGKIDLEAFMHQHYRDNIPLSEFAYRTGRSLATFKRDFTQLFKTPPGQWLLQKRLHDAYYLINKGGAKASDIYKAVGFKTLSHFNYSFKKAFNKTPNTIRKTAQLQET